MHVLVMTESWQAALACIQSFGRRGHRVSVLHPPLSLSPHAYSRFVHKRIPFDNDSGTRAERAERLLQLLRDESVDLVIPINDEDAHLLAECKAREPERRGLICPGLACVEIVRDRAQTETFCRENAIRIPQSILVSSLEELRAAAPELGFPLFIKASYSLPPTASTSSTAKMTWPDWSSAWRRDKRCRHRNLSRASLSASPGSAGKAS